MSKIVFVFCLILSVFMVSTTNLCSSESQACGVLQEGQKPCCSGYECVFPTDLIGAPGVCQKKSICAAHNEVCGVPSEGGKTCCEGYVCDVNVHLIGSKGVCRTEAEIQNKNDLGSALCAVRGEYCGAPQEGQKRCCSGYHCAQRSSALGAPGVCEPNSFLGIEILCASENQNCGLEEEGQRKCCEGYECSLQSLALGAPGKCVKKDLCAAIGDVCGIPNEGRKTCCEGECVYPIGLHGAPGRCAKVGSNVCAQYDESCGAPEEGGNLCCPGYRCIVEENAPIGAKGRCGLTM